MQFNNRERQVHDHIRDEIEARLIRTRAPRDIRDFLLNRWSYLLAAIYFNHGDHHIDWDAGWQTVNALLWSLTPKQDREETEQFLRLLPTLLARLQDGCDALNLDLLERDALFTQLAMLHAAVARAGLQTRPGEEGPVTLLGTDADLEMDDEELASLGQPAPEVAQEDEVSSVPEVAQEDEVSPVPEVAQEDQVSPVPQDALGIDDLKIGDGLWLETAEGSKTLFLQWASPMGGMYLFADSEGFDAISLTRARLVERLQAGDARLV